MNEYLVTFFDHHGAVQFRKFARSIAVRCVLSPVPRKLSTSCGTCARYTAIHWDIGFKKDELEAVYQNDNEKFTICYTNGGMHE